MFFFFFLFFSSFSFSEGSWPAGIDTSYPKKAIYPGVIAFYKELDLGIVGDDEWDNSRLGNLVFLSARPHVYKDVSENVTYQKLRRLQVTRGLHTSPSLLAGAVQNVTLQYSALHCNTPNYTDPSVAVSNCCIFAVHHQKSRDP